MSYSPVPVLQHQALPWAHPLLWSTHRRSAHISPSCCVGGCTDSLWIYLFTEREPRAIFRSFNWQRSKPDFQSIENMQKISKICVHIYQVSPFFNPARGSPGFRSRGVNGEKKHDRVLALRDSGVVTGLYRYFTAFPSLCANFQSTSLLLHQSISHSDVNQLNTLQSTNHRQKPIETENAALLDASWEI